MRFRFLTTALAFAVSLSMHSLSFAGMSSEATAIVTGVGSMGNPVSAELFLTYDGMGTLIVEVTNTSPSDSVITGFGLMGATASTDAADFSASGTLDDSEWAAANDQALNPEGTYDFAAITGNNLSGGDPNAGIPEDMPSNKGTFTFTDLVTDMDVNLARDFLELPNDKGFAYVVRFQSIQPGGGSAKVPGIGIVPEPATLAIWSLVGLCGVGAARRNRRKKA